MPRHLLARAGVLALAGTTMSCGRAQRAEHPVDTPNPRSASTADSVFAAIVHRAVTGGMPGIQAHVEVRGRTWTAVAGLASVEARRAMTARDRIRLASITKMMTYATVMELVRRGNLRLADRAVDLLAQGELAGVPHAREITVAHLLDHTSGLHNYNGPNGAAFFGQLFSDSLHGARRWSPRDLVAFAKDPRHPPSGRPGQGRSYSSTGYSVLELTLERVTGKPLAMLFDGILFAPLGMTRTGLEGADFGADAIVDSYARPTSSDLISPSPFRGRGPVRPDGLVNLSSGLQHYNAWAGAGGAAASTVSDLARFMAAVRAGTLIVLRDQRRQFAEAKARPAASFSWNGGSWGIQSTIIYEPHGEIVVIVLGNASNVNVSVHAVAKELLAAAQTERAARGSE